MATVFDALAGGARFELIAISRGLVYRYEHAVDPSDVFTVRANRRDVLRSGML